MSRRVKVDEDLPRAVAATLAAAGHAVRTVPEQGWSGWRDSEVWSSVQAETRILITADKGFADWRRLRGERHAGVVLLRLDRESWKGYVRLVRRLLATMRLEDAAGAIVVVTERGIRVRRR